MSVDYYEEQPDATPRTIIASKFLTTNSSQHYVTSSLPHPVFLPPAVRFEPIVRHFRQCFTDILFLAEKHRFEASEEFDSSVEDVVGNSDPYALLDPADSADGLWVSMVFHQEHEDKLSVFPPGYVEQELRDPDLDEDENEMIGRFCSNSDVALEFEICEVTNDVALDGDEMVPRVRWFGVQWWLRRCCGPISKKMPIGGKRIVTVASGERNQRMLSREVINDLSEVIIQDVKSNEVGVLYDNDGVRSILLLDQGQTISVSELGGFPDDGGFADALESFLDHSPTSVFVWHDFLVQIDEDEDEDEIPEDFLLGIPIERQKDVSRSFRLSMPLSVLHLPSRRFVPLPDALLCVPAPSFCYSHEISWGGSPGSVSSIFSGASGQLSVWTKVDTLNEPVVRRYLRSCGCVSDSDDSITTVPEDDRRTTVDAADLIVALRNAHKGLVWSPKNNRLHSSQFRSFVRFLLLCRSRSLEKKTSEDSVFGAVFGKIPLDVLLFYVLTYFDEMEVWTHMHPKTSMLSWLEKNEICRDQEDGKLVAIGDDEIRVPYRKISDRVRLNEKLLFGTIRFLQGCLRGQFEDEKAGEAALGVCCSWLRVVPEIATNVSGVLASLMNRFAVLIVRLFLSEAFVTVSDWPVSQTTVLLELWGSSWYPLVEQFCPEEIPFLLSKTMAAFQDGLSDVFLSRPDVCNRMIAQIRSCAFPSILRLLCEELMRMSPERHRIVFVEQLVSGLVSEKILWEDDIVRKAVIRMCGHHGRVCRAALRALSGHPKFVGKIGDLSKNIARLHRELIVNFLSEPDWFAAVVSEETSTSHLFRLVMPLTNVRSLKRLWTSPEDGVLVVLENLGWFVRNTQIDIDDAVRMDRFICHCLTVKMYRSSEIHLACLRVLQALFGSTGADLHKSTMELLSRTRARSPLFPQSDYLRCLLSFCELLKSEDLQKDLEDRIWYEELRGMIENGVGLANVWIDRIAEDAQELTRWLVSFRHSVEIGALKLSQDDCRKFFGCFERNGFYEPATTAGPSGFQCWIEKEWTELAIWLLAHDQPDWIPLEEYLRFVSRGLENPRSRSGEPTKYWRVVLQMLKNDAVGKSLFHHGSASFPLCGMLARDSFLGSVLLIRDLARYSRLFWLSLESVKVAIILAQSALIPEVDVALAEAKDALHSNDFFQVALLETVFHTESFDVDSAVWWLAFLRRSNLEALTSDSSLFFAALDRVDETSGSALLDKARELFASAKLLPQYVECLMSLRERKLSAKGKVFWRGGSVLPISFPSVAEFEFDGPFAFHCESDPESASNDDTTDEILPDQEIAESMPWLFVSIRE